MLSREDILGCDDLVRERVEIPEWNHGVVYVRVMTGAERDWLDAASLTTEGEPKSVEERLAGWRGRLVAATACHEDGRSLFNLADAPALGKKAARALDRIVDVAQRLNAITQHEVEVLTGTLKNDHDGGSGSDSP